MLVHLSICVIKIFILFLIYRISLKNLDFDVCYEIDSLYWDTYSSIYLGPMYEKCLSKSLKNF